MIPIKTYIGIDSVTSNLITGLGPLPEQSEPMLREVRDYGRLIYAQRHDGTWVDNRMPPKGLLE